MRRSKQKVGGEGTPHIPIEYILSDLYIRVGTLQKILRYLRSRGGTPHILIDGISELGWDTAQDYKMFLKQGGTPHIPIEGI